MSLNKIELIKNDIQRNINALEREYSPLSGSAKAVLNNLLGEVGKVDFHEKANIPEDGKISRKVYVVIVIDTLLALAAKKNWGLATRNGFIYVFNGAYWQPMDAEDFKPFLAKAAIKMGVPILEGKYHLFKDELYKQFLSESTLEPPTRGSRTLINVQNGTFEISEDRQKLREFDRNDFLKYQLPFAYNPDAKCPQFYNYLEKVLPDEGCRKVLAEYMGYVFINSLKLEKALILYGSGANGKSVFFEIINAILGAENICSYSLQNLTKYDSYQRAELTNKLLNYASEINGKLEASIFKQLVSGEPVEARQIFRRPFIMTDYAKLMFNCNELPKEVEQTNAFFRRFLIIPFDVTIPQAEQDPELAKKIIDSELSGVFNWILEGLKRLLVQKKFTVSKKVNDQIETYRRESDSVAMFVSENGYVPSYQSQYYLKAVYDEYKSYSLDNGYKLVSNRTFSERLKMLGFDVDKTRNGRIIYSIKE